MNERAVGGEDGLGPLWHVEGGHTFFAGPLAYNASHAHGAPVYLAGLYGAFRIRMRGQAWTTCRTAFVPAGVPHELDLGGDPLGVLYLEPDAVGAGALAPLVRDAPDIGGALVGDRGEVVPLRALYEDRTAPRWAGAALVDLSAFSGRRADRPLDGRVEHVLARLAERQDRAMSAERLAASVGLSASRLQHLFTQEVGVPFRRYRPGPGCAARSVGWWQAEASRRPPTRRASLTSRISPTISARPSARRPPAACSTSGVDVRSRA